MNSPDKVRLSPIQPQHDVNVPKAMSSGPSDSRVDIRQLPVTSLLGETPADPLLPQVVERRKPEILKSVVYGGLTEAITSLGVISSAAGSGASTCKCPLSLIALHFHCETQHTLILVYMYPCGCSEHFGIRACKLIWRAYTHYS